MHTFEWIFGMHFHKAALDVVIEAAPSRFDCAQWGVTVKFVTFFLKQGSLDTLR